MRMRNHARARRCAASSAVHHANKLHRDPRTVEATFRDRLQCRRFLHRRLARAFDDCLNIFGRKWEHAVFVLNARIIAYRGSLNGCKLRRQSNARCLRSSSVTPRFAATPSVGRYLRYANVLSVFRRLHHGYITRLCREQQLNCTKTFPCSADRLDSV
jgi:hypothetical protein